MSPVERLAATLADGWNLAAERYGLTDLIGRCTPANKAEEAQHLLDHYPWLGPALDGDPRPLMIECGAPWIGAVREIAQTELVVDSDFGYEHCVFCGGDDTDSPMGRVAHDPDCAWLRLNKAFPPEAEVLPAAADKEPPSA